MVTRQNEEWLQEPASPAAPLFPLENRLSAPVLQPRDGEAPSNACCQLVHSPRESTEPLAPGSYQVMYSQRRPCPLGPSFPNTLGYQTELPQQSTLWVLGTECMSSDLPTEQSCQPCLNAFPSQENKSCGNEKIWFLSHRAATPSSEEVLGNLLRTWCCIAPLTYRSLRINSSLTFPSGGTQNQTRALLHAR